MPYRHVMPNAPRDRWGHVAGDPHHNFLRSRQWEKIRRAFLKLHVCASTAPCSDAPPAATTADHIERLTDSDRRTHGMVGLQALCAEHHNHKCNWERGARRWPLDLGIDRDGYTIELRPRLCRDARAPRILDGASGLSAILCPHQFDEGAHVFATGVACLLLNGPGSSHYDPLRIWWRRRCPCRMGQTQGRADRGLQTWRSTLGILEAFSVWESRSPPAKPASSGYQEALSSTATRPSASLRGSSAFAEINANRHSAPASASLRPGARRMTAPSDDNDTLDGLSDASTTPCWRIKGKSRRGLADGSR